MCLLFAFCHTVRMQRPDVPTFRLPALRRRPRHQAVGARAFAVLLLLAPAVAAQTPAPTTPPKASPGTATAPAPYTLHVYENLVQIPTLVLTQQLEPTPSFALKQFDISLDSGRTFQPTRMHVEGDEPLSLAILIDDSRDPFHTLHTLGPLLAGLVPHYLHPQDHISIFAVDCDLVRSVDNRPVDAAMLQLGVSVALHFPTLHGGPAKPSCGHSLHLWDGIARVTSMLSKLPEWRVLIVISTGDDTASIYKWANVNLYVASNGVAVYGVRDSQLLDIDSRERSMPGTGRGGFSHPFAYTQENLFELLCDSNGGLVLDGPTSEFGQELARIIAMLRGRYILEFPRPDSSASGLHSIVVTVPHRSLFISSAGVTIPLPDPSIRNDPTTVPSAPSPATLGTRRPLLPH
jgi:hypothetical protein